MKYLKIIAAIVLGNTTLGCLYVSRSKYLYPEIMGKYSEGELIYTRSLGPLGVIALGFVDRANQISWAKGPWRWMDNTYECLSDGVKIAATEYKELLPKK